MSNNLIEQLEASLEMAPTTQSEALATLLAAHLLALSVESSLPERENAVRGLIALNHHYYRIGDLARAGAMLAVAQSLAKDLPAKTRVAVLLRRGELELLTCDVGAALDHTAEAMEIARAAGLRVDEARAWTNYGMALQSAGLAQQADDRLSYALELIDGLDEPRLAGNIWSLRSQLGWHLEEKDFEQAAYACEQALICAESSPSQFRDSMACTALCNSAAMEILRGNVAAAIAHLANAAGRKNLGTRPRWLVAVLEAMVAVRRINGETEREALNALLTPEKAPARAYVIETYSVLAALYTSIGDGDHAHEALKHLSEERARALWATLSDPGVLDKYPGGLSRISKIVDTSTMSVLERLAVTAELRDDATGKHCFRVGRLSMLLAHRAGLSAIEIDDMDLAARLHDIGKFAIPDAILLKPARLDAAEMQLMRTHTTIGADLLADAAHRVSPAAQEIARHHHEFWNGAGYPLGIAGVAIPIAARIAALADVYDALSHSRPYKQAWSHVDALAYIKKMRGVQFDPRLTDLFLEMMQEAAGDLASFLASLEDAALDSPFIVAQTRIANALSDDAIAV